MMNGEEKEAEGERRRCVMEAMHLIPVDVDYHDGCVVLTILYDIGWLRLYLRQNEEREQDQYVFQFKINVKTDSIGRITSFSVPHIENEDDDDDDEPVYYDLPPSVSRLHKLQKIEIMGCRQIPVELGDLPLLTDIKFSGCNRNLFDSIPVGLQLPHLQCASVEALEIPNSLIPFLNVLPNGLKELHFENFEKDESNTIISALQNYELNFHQSLITFGMESAKVDDGSFEKLLFEVLPRFPNLRNLNLPWNDIKSLRGVEKKIKELGFVSNTKLTKLNLRGNDVFYSGLVVSSEDSKSVTREIKEIETNDEKSAALLILNTFDKISNLGGSVREQYDSDIEGVLRNNLMKRPFTDEGINGSWPSNAALWPFMLEKVYNNSWKVYDENKYMHSAIGQESKMEKKCSTELFHMVRYGPIFAIDQCPQHEITTATTAPATKKQRTKK